MSKSWVDPATERQLEEDRELERYIESAEVGARPSAGESGMDTAAMTSASANVETGRVDEHGERGSGSPPRDHTADPQKQGRGPVSAIVGTANGSRDDGAVPTGETGVGEPLGEGGELASVSPIKPVCLVCGFEFKHGTWLPGDGKLCPDCGAINYIYGKTPR